MKLLGLGGRRGKGWLVVSLHCMSSADESKIGMIPLQILLVLAWRNFWNRGNWRTGWTWFFKNWKILTWSFVCRMWRVWGRKTRRKVCSGSVT